VRQNLDLPTVVVYGFGMWTSQGVRDQVFSYEQFRAVTELSKKEADGWTKSGIIRAELSANGRRRLYRFEAMMEGIIAKQLADFSSRELLANMMKSLRQFLKEQRIDLSKISSDPEGPRVLVRIHTQRSKEIMPGGGVRGVITYVSLFDPSSQLIQKGVFLVVDLTMIAVHAISAVGRLSAV